MSRRPHLTTLLCILSLLAAACGGGTDPDPAAGGEASAGADVSTVPDNSDEGVTADEIRLGWMGDVTGPTASSQAFNLAGSQAAVEYYNEQGGVLGRDLVLLDRDDQFQAETALQNYQSLVEDDRVLALLQMGGGHISEALMPDVESDQIPVIGPPQTIDAQLGNPYVFNNMAHYSDQADVAVEYMIDEVVSAEDLRVAVIHLELPSGQEWNDYVQSRLEERGGTHVDNIVLNVSSPDYAAAALELQQLVEGQDVNYIALSGSPASAIGMMFEMQNIGLEVPSIGIHGITGPTTYEEGPEALHDLVKGIHSFLPATSDCELCGVIRESQGEDADSNSEINFAHGWLDVYIAIQAIERAAESGEVSRASLFDALQGEFDTGGLACPIDWSESNHSPCAVPFTWDGEVLVPIGSFEEWAEVLQGEYQATG